MSKVIPSPVKCWPGQVLISDQLTFPQYIAWQDAVDAASQLLTKTKGEDGKPQGLTLDEIRQNARMIYAMVPGVLACVEGWQLDHFPNRTSKPGDPVTAETFPSTPLEASYALLQTLIEEINQVVLAADAVPNG